MWLNLELIGTITGIICVWLTVKQSIWNWPIGLINIVCLGWVFYNAHLYPDVVLHTIFFILSIYGWIHWSKRNDEPDLPVTILTIPDRVLWGISIIGVSLLVGHWFKANTSASFPYVDSLTTTMSVAAQYLLTRKKLENWILWIAGDVIMIGMYAIKGLTFIPFLYIVYLGLATAGFISWNRQKQLA